MNKNRILLSSGILLITLGMLLGSCRKYEDGPSFSFISKKERVTNTWTASEIFRNDIDETKDFDIYSMQFTKNGRLTWTIQPAGFSAPVSESADWELASVKEQIKLTFDTPDPVSGETRLLYMDILRLTEDQLWISFLQDGDYYDLRLD